MRIKRFGRHGQSDSDQGFIKRTCLVLIHPLLSATATATQTVTTPATTSSAISAHCMEEPAADEPPRYHHRNERPPSGQPKNPRLPRKNLERPRGNPQPGDAPTLDTTGTRGTSSAPRPASPDKANDSSNSRPHRRNETKPKSTGTPGVQGSRDPADTKRPTKESGSRQRRNRGKPDDGTTDASDSKPPRRGNKPAPGQKSDVDSEPIRDSPNANSSSLKQGRSRQRRQGNFDGKLTTGDSEARQEGRRVNPNREKYRVDHAADDLTSTLIHDLRTPPFLDCTICFNPIRPHEPTWSCSPTTPVEPTEDSQQAQCCWVTLHLKCVRSWASKSIADVRQAYKARGEDKPGQWPCPGCRAKRTTEPSSYKYAPRRPPHDTLLTIPLNRCFCGAEANPKPPRLATPHSCGNPCTRPRTCGHPCPIFCHPGPCPPCQITSQVPCHCGSKVLSYKCSNIFTSGPGVAERISCGNVCDKKLSCGNHSCANVCHPEPCTPCAEREIVKCYCGEVDADIACGAGEPQSCSVDGEESWIGRFGCENTCQR